MFNKTKKALALSMIILVLCFGMFIGTTYAWFTDSVSSAGNIIQTGTLKVGMQWLEGTEDLESDSWKDASVEAIFDYKNWEPGYVDAKHIKISNNGTLALKYIVNIKANGEVSKLAEVIDVYFVDGGIKLTDRSLLSDSYKVGTLADVLAGKVAPARGDLLKGEFDIVTIALKMQEDAGNEYQKLSIGSEFAVQVLATQLTSESDSFDNLYDNEAVTLVEYDETKTVAENATALQAALDAASEGDIIVLGAGNWYATKYKQFKINTDGITLVGENGAVLGFEEENRNSILDVYGDNVTIRNIEFNKNKNEYNQCLLAIGAENLTVDSCTFYGENYQGGNTPTMGIYIFENLDSSTVEAKDEVTKYTIVNNNFLGAAIGSYKGGKDTVATDPGADAAEVSEDMIIKNNTFVEANILIENWRSWSKECTRDHEYVPTIEENIFVSPNLCFANTPHSIYLRCYRQGNPDKILPAGYIDAFVANNTIEKPANDTVVTYGGVDYVLNNNYGTFYRDNATYGIIAYCYGQSYMVKVENNAELDATLKSGVTTIYLGDGNYVLPNSAQGKTLTIVGNGNTVIATKSDGSYEGCNYALDGSTVTFEGIVINTTSTTYVGYARSNITYNNCTINGTYTLYGNSVFNNCTFNVSGDAYNLWTWGAPVATFNNCTFNSDGKALLLYGQANTKLTLNDCVFNDKGGLSDKKAAIEIGNDYNTTYEVIVNNTIVNGYEINDKGINTGTTLWGNKNSMGTDKLNVVVDNVDVY